MRTLNPVAPAATRYLPGCTPVNTYNPALFVLVRDSTLVSTLVKTTCAPTTADPPGSVTRPDRVADSLWARQMPDKAMTTQNERNLYIQGPRCELVEQYPHRSGVVPPFNKIFHLDCW